MPNLIVVRPTVRTTSIDHIMLLVQQEKCFYCMFFSIFFYQIYFIFCLIFFFNIILLCLVNPWKFDRLFSFICFVWLIHGLLYFHLFQVWIDYIVKSTSITFTSTVWLPSSRTMLQSQKKTQLIRNYLAITTQLSFCLEGHIAKNHPEIRQFRGNLLISTISNKKLLLMRISTDKL